MGSNIEINDTLQITKEQGFPEELDFEKHQQTLLTAGNFKDKIFNFHDKPGKRIYHNPPVRNFLVENKNGKWLYWGLIHMLEVTYDASSDMTSGKYKIIYLYTPEEMKIAHQIIDRNPQTNFFN